MQKLSFILLTTLFAQGALASKVVPSYANAALIVAETGASAWTAQETLVAEQNARKIEMQLDAANEKLNSKLEQRFSSLLESQALSK